MNVSDYKVWKLLDIYVDEARFNQELNQHNKIFAYPYGEASLKIFKQVKDYIFYSQVRWRQKHSSAFDIFSIMDRHFLQWIDKHHIHAIFINA
jgi:hypothetical protein